MMLPPGRVATLRRDLPWPVMITATFLSAMGLLVPLTIGAMSDAVGQGLHATTAGLGVVISLCLATMAVASRPVARMLRSSQLHHAVLLASGGILVSLVLCAVSPSLVTLGASMAIGGVASAAFGPIVARALTQTVRPDLLAPAQCIVAAGMPAASLFAGLMGSVLVERAGWRVTLAAVGVGAFLTVLASHRTLDFNARPGASHARPGRSIRVPIVMLAVATGLGTHGVSSVATFFGSHAVSAGFQHASAAAMLAVLAGLSVIARASVGVVLSSNAASMSRLAAYLVTAGGLGYLLMAVNEKTAFVIGAGVVFTIGWSFLGVVLGTTVATQADASSAIAQVQVGLFVGIGLAPIIYGGLFERVGPAAADMWSALATFASGALLLVVAARSEKTG